MKLLLDTHVVLWFLNGEKLSEETIAIIESSENYNGSGKKSPNP